MIERDAGIALSQMAATIFTVVYSSLAFAKYSRAEMIEVSVLIARSIMNEVNKQND